MYFRYTGTDQLAYKRWQYYMRLAIKARTLAGANYWLRIAKNYSIK
jgi:hypothetical protein